MLQAAIEPVQFQQDLVGLLQLCTASTHSSVLAVCSLSARLSCHHAPERQEVPDLPGHQEICSTSNQDLVGT